VNLQAHIVGQLPAAGGLWPRLRACAELTRPRVVLLVAAATAAAYLLSEQQPLRGYRFIQTVLATSLVAAGAGAVNQYMERAADALMKRTACRPLPAGVIAPAAALGLGLVCIAGGTAWLAMCAGAAALPAAFAAVVYLLAYTPLKRISAASTLIGAVAGAMPALVGCWAGAGALTPAGTAMFIIIFLWQMPHFLAIAIIHAEDYARAGFRMLTSCPGEVRAAGRQMVLYSLALVPAVLLPAAQGLAGACYTGAALAACAAMVLASLRCARRPEKDTASAVLAMSVLHLGVVMSALVLDASR